MSRRQFLKQSTILSVSATSLFSSASLLAQDNYPERPIEFIVPWSPGGGSDIMMRFIAQYLTEEVGVAIPVINMPGVSGTQGLKEFDKRKRDGYTISQIHEGLITGHYSGLTDQNWNSFDLVAQMVSSYQFVAVHADSPWETFDDFVQAAKAEPRSIKTGVTLGGVPHLHMAMIEEASGIELGYVGYEGTSERIRALVGKNIDVAIADVGNAESFIKNGDLKFLAAGSPERDTEAPDVPTLMELGYDLDLSVSRGVVLPKGTDQAINDKLASALERISENPEFRESVSNAGGNVSYLGPEAYAEKLSKLDDIIKKLTEQLVG